MLIDTHAHVNFSAFREDADEVAERAFTKNIFFINVGSQYSTSVRAVEYAKKYPGKIWAAVGTHPVHLRKGNFIYKDNEELVEEPARNASPASNDVATSDRRSDAGREIKTNGEDVDFEKYRELAKNKEVVAIGEVGLDYHHFSEEDDIEEMKNKQKEIFMGFINLANELEKPIIIHCWDAYGDLLEILKNNPVKKEGVIHSFVGGYKTAKKFTELGYFIGLNGVITYANDFNRLVKEIPLEKILVETDCPYLSPVPLKGERNEPAYVEHVAKKIAEIKQISLEKVNEITTENAKKLFEI